MTWKCVKIHGVPVARYAGRGCFVTERHREELEAQNDGCRSPPQSDGWPRVGRQGRFSEGEIEASSVIFPVLGEAAFSCLQERSAAPGPPLYR